jgi:hypothetical protein
VEQLESPGEGWQQSNGQWAKKVPLTDLDVMFYASTYVEWNRMLWSLSWVPGDGSVGISFVKGSAPEGWVAAQPGVTRARSNPEVLVARVPQEQVRVVASYSYHYDLTTKAAVGAERWPDLKDWAAQWQREHGPYEFAAAAGATVTSDEQARQLLLERIGGRAPDVPGAWEAERFDGGWRVWYKVDDAVPFSDRPFGAPWYVVGEEGRTFISAGSYFPADAGVAWFRKHILGKDLGYIEEQLLSESAGNTPLMVPCDPAPQGAAQA